MYLRDSDDGILASFHLTIFTRWPDIQTPNTGFGSDFERSKGAKEVAMSPNRFHPEDCGRWSGVKWRHGLMGKVIVRIVHCILNGFHKIRVVEAMHHFYICTDYLHHAHRRRNVRYRQQYHLSSLFDGNSSSNPILTTTFMLNNSCTSSFAA